MFIKISLITKMDKQITNIFQDCVLFHDTVFNNIQYGDLNKSVEEVYQAAMMAEIHDSIVNRFPARYETQVGERGLKLSGKTNKSIFLAELLSAYVLAKGGRMGGRMLVYLR